MIAVLALQGAFREHKQAFERLGQQVKEVRLPEDLTSVSGVVIPGGESTTMAKLMKSYGFDQALPAYYQQGGAIWGTCAGAIMVAKRLLKYPEQFALELMDISVERNAYGRQVDSFEAELDITPLDTPFKGMFIRAPRIIAVADGVEVLASYQGDPVIVRQGRLMASVFHPELSGDDRLHQYFLEQVVHAKAVQDQLVV